MTSPLRAALALCATFALALPAAAQPETLRLSHWLPPNHPVAELALKPWMEAITADSGGSITFETYPAGQLGKAEDHYDLARDGIADLAWLNPGFNAGRFPLFSAGQLPMTVSDGIRGMQVFNQWYAPYATAEMADVKFCLAHMLAPIAFYSTKRIERPQDLHGLKIRPSSAMEALLIRGAGGSTVAGSSPESREMLSRGIIDATTGVPNSNILFGVTEVTDYALDMPFSAVTFALVLNKSRYEAMTEEQRAVLDRHCSPEAAVRYFAAPQQLELAGLDKIRAAGKPQIVTPSAEAIAEWQAAAQNVVAAWSAEVGAKGYDGAALYADLRQRLRAAQALVE